MIRFHSDAGSLSLNRERIHNPVYSLVGVLTVSSTGPYEADLSQFSSKEAQKNQ